QRGRVTTASSDEDAGGCPGPVRWIVEFRARECVGVVVTACDEHLAVGQQRGRVSIACGGKTASGLKLKWIARARVHHHQPSTQNKQREHNPPRKNQAGRPKTGDQGIQCFHSFILHVFHWLRLPGFSSARRADMSPFLPKEKSAGNCKKNAADR